MRLRPPPLSPAAAGSESEAAEREVEEEAEEEEEVGGVEGVLGPPLRGDLRLTVSEDLEDCELLRLARSLELPSSPSTLVLLMDS